MEYHEEANAMGLDLLKGYQWCLDAAEITGGIVFPPLPVSPNWFWLLSAIWGPVMLVLAGAALCVDVLQLFKDNRTSAS